MIMFNLQPDSMHAGDEPLRNRITSLESEADAKDLEPARPRVLVVDDHKLIADTMTEILAEVRHEIGISGYFAASAGDKFFLLKVDI
jgi:PleD family two-component response regulator